MATETVICVSADNVDLAWCRRIKMAAELQPGDDRVYVSIEGDKGEVSLVRIGARVDGPAFRRRLVEFGQTGW